MEACIQKEGRRLDLSAPFGELDPVRGVLFTVSGHSQTKEKEERVFHSENLLGSIRPFRFNSVAVSLANPRLTCKTIVCLLKVYSPANRTGSPQGFHKFISYTVA